MAAVAERGIFGVFAPAPGHRFCFGDFRFHGSEAGPLVGAVAERLAFGLTATAPEISAGLGGLNERTFLGDFRFTHNRWI
jgi:hypothetical protein